MLSRAASLVVYHIGTTDMPTTEIAGFPLIDGVTMDSIADDPNSEAALRIKEWSDVIVRQKGYHATSYGTIAESPSDLVAVISRYHAYFSTEGRQG